MISKNRATNKWIVALSVMTGTIMAALNTSSVNVALPYMQGSLGASTTEITWVVASYMLANVIIMPIIAMISSRFGRKNFYQFAAFLFLISSIACGFAENLTTLIIFRTLQGIGGGALIPMAQAIMRETFPPKEQAAAMGIYGLGVILGPALGPTVGGWVTDNYSWHWVFFINIPVGIINMVMVYLFIHDPSYLERIKSKIDFPGLAFMVVGLGALQILLQKGEEKNWFGSSFIVSLSIIAAVGILLFIIRELTTENPAVNLKILKNINLSIGTFIGGILGLGLYGSLFILPKFLQQILGYPAFDSGLAMVPRVLSMAISMPLAGRLYNKFGPKILIGSGLFITCISFWQLSTLNLNADYWSIFWPQFFQGIGFGMIFVPLSTTALITVEKKLMTSAVGLYNVVRQIAGSIGTAIVATGISSGTTFYRSIIVKNISVYNDATNNYLDTTNNALMSGGSDSYNAGLQSFRLLGRVVTEQASMLAYNRVFFMITVLFVVSIPLVFLFRENKL